MKSKNLKYFYILLVAFVISANIAWLNPTPNDPENQDCIKHTIKFLYFGNII